MDHIQGFNHCCICKELWPTGTLHGLLAFKTLQRSPGRCNKALESCSRGSQMPNVWYCRSSERPKLLWQTIQCLRVGPDQIGKCYQLWGYYQAVETASEELHHLVKTVLIIFGESVSFQVKFLGWSDGILTSWDVWWKGCSRRRNPSRDDVGVISLFNGAWMANIVPL